MTYLAIALGLGPLELSVIFVAGLAFIVMFGISSLKGGYKDLIDTTLENDKTRRKIK